MTSSSFQNKAFGSKKHHRSIPSHIDGILREIRNEFEKLYAERMKGLILFGSYARGDYTGSSDLDLVLLLDKIDDILKERECYLPITGQLSLKYNMVISIIPFSTADFTQKKTPLLLNVRREGMRV